MPGSTRLHLLASTSTISLILAAAPLAAQSADVRVWSAADKLYFEPCPPFAERYAFDCYHSYAEVTQFLRDAAAQHPRLASLSSMGRSYQGRDLWVLTITDASTGTPENKPAIFIDGGIDADEVVAVEAALGVVHRLLTSDEPGVQELLRTRTFYIAPMVIPDASEIHHMTPERPRDTTLRPWDDDNDGVADEDLPDDLDGDGQALQMRQRHALGEWVGSEEDARVMRRRRVGDDGPFYRVYSEGRDDDGDGEYNEDPTGGVDPNRNYPGNWSLEQGGNGVFAGSEVELRAMLDFIAAHPNIAASQHYHSSGGVVLRPPSVPDLELPQADLDLYLELSRRGLEVSGYDLATSVYDWNWPRGSRNTKSAQVWRDNSGNLRGAGESDYPAFGGSIDALYLLFGALAFANEIYAMGADDDEDGRIEAHEQLRHNDEVQNGYAFAEWTAFEHPQLGTVEIGGWRKFGHNNPPPAELPEEVRRNVEFALMQAENTQLLALGEVDVVSLGSDVFRVTVPVRNVGRTPTELAQTVSVDRDVPVRVEVSGSDVEVLSSDARSELGVIGGYGEEEAEFVVRAAPGATLRVRAWHPKAGTVTESVTLQ